MRVVWGWTRHSELWWISLSQLEKNEYSFFFHAFRNTVLLPCCVGCRGIRKTCVCYLPFSVRDRCNCKSWPWPFVGMTLIVCKQRFSKCKEYRVVWGWEIFHWCSAEVPFISLPCSLAMTKVIFSSWCREVKTESLKGLPVFPRLLNTAWLGRMLYCALFLLQMWIGAC